MKICQLLQQHNIERDDIKTVIGKAALDIYPQLKEAQWTEQDAFDIVSIVDLNKEEINTLLLRATKYGNIWIFS